MGVSKSTHLDGVFQEGVMYAGTKTPNHELLFNDYERFYRHRNQGEALDPLRFFEPEPGCGVHVSERKRGFRSEGQTGGVVKRGRIVMGHRRDGIRRAAGAMGNQLKQYRVQRPWLYPRPSVDRAYGERRICCGFR